MEPLWDVDKVCKCPHKGWYVHYYDNGLRKYGNRLHPDDYLEDFPGLNHIYLRLAWSYLEPQEGHYNWQLIDEQIDRWTARGYGISFRISCKETASDQTYATPEWVKDAGAAGTFLPILGGGCSWEPDYGDPVFLDKLESFHRAFADRYDRKPWLEYVDVGSYGDWGEGHTASSSNKDWPVEVIRRHIDIHCACYTRTQLMVSDDIVGSRKAMDGTKEDILAYISEKGLTLRDDGVCVKWFADTFGLSTLRNPEMFDNFWPSRPIDLELEHYDTTVATGTWKGGTPFIAAVEEAHASFVGFHGYPREWLSQNAGVAKELANRVGYWFFPKSYEAPETAKSGETICVKLVWENHGVAPAYNKYSLKLLLWNPATGTQHRQELQESDNRRWLPGRIVGESYLLHIPYGLPPGAYRVGLALTHDSAWNPRPVELGLTNAARWPDGFYHVCELGIE